MKSHLFCVSISLGFLLGIAQASAKTFDNQTATLSPVLPATNLPFQIVIERAPFTLPVGFHSGVVGVFNGLWVFIAGRINGLHGFDPDNNFPPDEQNKNIYVVNPATGAVIFRALSDPHSGLNQHQIDTLSVTSPQGFQLDNTLYMTGGYGVDSLTGRFTTKSVLTAIYLPGVVDWVMNKKSTQNILPFIKQIYNPIFKITGGGMAMSGNVMQLIFGQDFEGQYTDNSNGQYSEQVRQFIIQNINGKLSVQILNSIPAVRNPNFRRRDLNIVPALLNNNNQLSQGQIAYAGVFTPSTGVWTVPVVINGSKPPVMANPNAATTFKQAMNQYSCATASLYSRKYSSMYHIFFGGISFGFFSNGVFKTDDEIPFINQVTTVQMDKNGHFKQFLMPNQYPTILSDGPHPGNPLLFGASAYFIPTPVRQYPNGVISLDSIRQPVVIGYIVGGIQSTLPNTNVQSDSAASPYVFKVSLLPKA